MANNKQDKILNVPNKREQRQTRLTVAEREALRSKGSVPNKREQRNVPALRFPEFEGEWLLKRLGDDCKIQMCKRIFANQTSENGDGAMKSVIMSSVPHLRRMR